MELLQQISTIIIYAGIVQGAYFAVLLNHNKAKNPANKYLSILLLALSFSIIHSVFIVPQFQTSIIECFRLKEPFILVIIPLIWLYVQKLEKPNKRFNIKVLLHFLPFFLLVTIYFMPYISGSLDVSTKFYMEHSLISIIIIGIIILIQYSLYLINIIKLINRYKLKTIQEVSNTENIDLGWLKTFLYIFFAVFEILIVMFIITIHKGQIDQFNQVVSVIFSLIIFILGYRGLFQKSIFSNIDAPSLLPEIEMSKRITSTIKPDEQIIKKLKDYMKEEKPFSDPELTLTSLATKIGISRNQLSEVINNGLGLNFYDFINNYRLEEIKRLMSDPSCNNFTILSLAYEAGFQSKSTFNNFFKKQTGLTPSEYRSALLKNK